MHTPRGLDRALFQKLVVCDWIDRHEGLLVTAPADVGKSWLACALTHKACRNGRRVLYQRVPRLFEAVTIARDSRLSRALKAPAKIKVPSKRRNAGSSQRRVCGVR